MDNRTLIDPGGGERTLAVPAGEDRTQAFAPEDAARTQMGITLTCPVCDTQNAGGTEWCGECGFRLDAAPGSAPSPELNAPPITLTDAQGNTYPLYRGESALGRQDTTVLLPHPTVSRRHARITVDEGGAWIEDLGSSNGTKVDGNRLNPGEPVELRDGSSVEIGAVALTVGIRPPVLAGAGVLEPTDESATGDAPPLHEHETEGEEGDALQEAPEVVAAAEEFPLDTGMAEPLVLEEALSSGPRLTLPSGDSFPLPEGAITVGRRNTNDLVLPDAYVSGSHALLSRSGETVEVVDNDSTNGTFLNGDRLAPGSATPIKDGDVLAFGQTEVTFHAGE